MKRQLQSFFQFQYLLEVICPNIYYFIPKDSINWQKINKKYSDRLSFLELKLKYLMDIEISFSELLFLYFVKKDKSAEDLLNLFNKCLGIINEKIKSNDLKSQFKKGTISKLLEEPSSNYLNFLGEVFCLAKILDTQGYELLNIEYALPNGKRFDFGIKNNEIDNGRGFLIEILNIHVKDSLNILHRITTKIEEKLKDKFSKIQEADIQTWNYGLIPVVWCDIEILKETQQLVRQNKLDFERVFEIFSIVHTIHYNGESYFSFGAIKEMYLK